MSISFSGFDRSRLEPDLCFDAVAARTGQSMEALRSADTSNPELSGARALALSLLCDPEIGGTPYTLAEKLLGFGRQGIRRTVRAFAEALKGDASLRRVYRAIARELTKSASRKVEVVMQVPAEAEVQLFDDGTVSVRLDEPKVTFHGDGTITVSLEDPKEADEVLEEF